MLLNEVSEVIQVKWKDHIHTPTLYHVHKKALSPLAQALCCYVADSKQVC